MAVVETSQVDIKEMVLGNLSFGPKDIENLRRTIENDFSKYSLLRDSVAELEVQEDRSPATQVRLGVCYYLLGRYRLAVETLSSADSGAVAYFYLGHSHFSLERYGEAIGDYDSAIKAGYDKDECAVAKAAALRASGKAEEALKVLDNLFGPIEQTAEYLYQRGATVAALGGNPHEVIALYERAVQIDDRHAGALFGLAFENDRYGNDDDALRLYQRSVSCFPTHVGALLNLGVLYEDRQEFERARQCYQRILDVYPNDHRARMFLTDVQASSDMFYDEEAAKRRERMEQVLSVPVTDFELSVRSRNCLQKMGVLTLGDLTRTTEAELLASKNFGETSLVEIREMLTAKGLELGQFAHERPEPEPQPDFNAMSADEQALLEQPISDLNLSVRARKCMVRLGLNTIAELVRKSGDDLLECKNFGVTSLNEVREKLSEHGLRLRGE